MKAFAILAVFLLPLPVHAGEGSSAFRDAFRAYGNLRRLEEQSRITEQRTDLEEGERLALTRKVEAQLTEARIDFQAFQRPGSHELSNWEKGILKNAGAPKLRGTDPAALDFLSLAFGKTAAGWSPSEWQCVQEWFGKDVADSFLKITFSMEEPGDAPSEAEGVKTILWITDPAGLFLRKDEAARAKAQRTATMKELQRKGFAVQEVEVHPFPRLDDQAEELQAELERRLSDQPAYLVSTGHASAVFLRTLDLNPRLLGASGIRGWVNVNGKLFGEESVARGPASVAKADRQLAEARRELLPLRAERLERQTPLSPKFPVVNLVNFAGDRRPGSNLRDSLVPEGTSLYVKKNDAVEMLPGALPYLLKHAPSGQRDFSPDASL